MKSKIGSLLKALLLAALLAVPIIVMNTLALAAEPADPPVLVRLADKQNGIAYVSWWYGQYSAPTADIAVEALSDTGANWMSLLTTWYQDTITSTDIYSHPQKTPTDADLQHVVETAHGLGLKVMLKPHLDLAPGAPGWRSEIGSQFTTTEQWDGWFISYTHFITYYATMAQDLGVDQFCVGTELMATEAQSVSWRNVISAVTEIYTGPVTYAANHGAENDITWWDAVDYIGVDAYYRLVQDPANTDPSVAELKAAWAPIVTSLSALSERYGNRPIIFTEIGYRSVDGVTYQPGESTAGTTLDMQEQVDAYQAMFESVYDQPWFGGLYLWAWETNPVQGGPCDTGYTPFNKPAENIVRQWYGAEQKKLPGSGVEPKPDYDNALSLYSDQLDNGWGNSSWGGAVAFTATDEVYDGDYAIRGDFLPNLWGGIAMNHSPALDTTPYRWLEFALRKDNADRQLRIFANTDITELPKVSETCYVVEENDGWMLVRVPLTMFYANDRLIQQFAVQNFTAMSGTIWMDNIRLVPAAPTVDFTQAEYSVNEDAGEAVISVTLVTDVALTEPFTVSYATQSYTATAGSDFITSTGTLVFAPGVTEMSFTVTISDDDVTEPTEALALILSNPEGGDQTIQLGSQNNPAALNIVDNDGAEFKIFLPLILRGES